MKIDLKKSSILFAVILLLTLLCAVNSFDFTEPRHADAANFSGIVTVTYENQVYRYADSHGNQGENSSLQAIIDLVESNHASASFEFVALPVHEPIYFCGTTVAQGALNFDFTQNAYAVTVKPGARLTFSGMTVHSKRGGVMVAYGSDFQFISGVIEITECTYSSSALNVRGDAIVSGGNIIYSDRNQTFGYGLSVNGGNLTISPETPVRIEGHSALCVAAGYAEINGGEFIANRSESESGSSAGFSVDVQDGETVITDGNFPSPIFDRRSGSYAKFTVTGGEFKSIISAPAPSKYLTLFETKVFAGLQCSVKIEFTAPSTAVFGGIKRNGYRITHINIDGTSHAAGQEIDLSAPIASIRPVEDNHRKIELIYAGEVYFTQNVLYGAVIRPNELPAPDVLGYTMAGWQDIDGAFSVAEDLQITAIMELSAPKITFSETEFIYNASTHTVVPAIAHDLNVTFDYLWERQVNAAWQTLGREKELQLSTVSDSGLYRFSVTATYGTDRRTAQETTEFVIEKGGYLASEVPAPSFDGVYDPNKRLFDYKLPAGFRWADLTIIPTVPIKLYSAIYNGDPENYRDFPLDISIDLQKAAPVIPPAHNTLRAVYEGKTLKSYQPNENFRWQNPEEIPVVKKTSYEAFYNIDMENYMDYPCYIRFTLEKGRYGDDKKLDKINTVFRPNYTLAAFNGELSLLHPGYRLVYTQNYLTTHSLSAGTTEWSCAYNGDAENYHDYTFSLTVDVAKATYRADQIPHSEPVFYGTYSGKTLSEYPLPSHMFWQTPNAVPQVNIETYDAYYNADQENYNDYPLSVKLILQKGQYSDADIVKPVLEPVVYDRNVTLNSIGLPNGWRWKDASIIPTVNRTIYEAEFCNDEINYEIYAADLRLTVNKADIPLQILKDRTVVYNGEPHYLTLENPPYPLTVDQYLNNGQIHARRYEITAEIAQTDTENYTLHPKSVKGILTIEKAPSVIIAPTRYDVLEGTAPTVDGRVENTEQNLIIPSFTETTPGVYTLLLETLESSNYLAGKLAVTVAVNKIEQYVGNVKYPSTYDGTYYYGIIYNDDTGVPFDAEIAYSAFDTENDTTFGLQISITVDGAPYLGKFTAKVLMPEKMLSASEIKLTCGGNDIPYHIENEIYIVFDTDGNGQYLISTIPENRFAWWWIPIGIGLGLIVIGGIFMVLWKKGIIKLSIPVKPRLKKTADTKPVEEKTTAEEPVVEKDPAEKSDENEKEQTIETNSEGQ